MNDIGAIFENLYRQFILRDLLAKMMPGFIGFVATYCCFFGSLRKLLWVSSRLTFWQWLIVFSLAWIMGFMFQHTGIMLGHLSDQTYYLRKRKEEASLKERFRQKTDVFCKANEDFKKALERVIVIKEACGNTSAAVLYSDLLISVRLVTHLLCHQHRVSFIGSLWTLLLIVVTAAAAYVLWDAHWYHADREEYLRRAFNGPNYVLDC